jgi:hypothetical protein
MLSCPGSASITSENLVLHSRGGGILRKSRSLARFVGRLLACVEVVRGGLLELGTPFSFIDLVRVLCAVCLSPFSNTFTSYPIPSHRLSLHMRALFHPGPLRSCALQAGDRERETSSSSSSQHGIVHVSGAWRRALASRVDFSSCLSVSVSSIYTGGNRLPTLPRFPDPHAHQPMISEEREARL